MIDTRASFEKTAFEFLVKMHRSPMSESIENKPERSSEQFVGSQRLEKKQWSAPQVRDLGDVAKETKNFPSVGDDGVGPGSGATGS